MSKILSIYKGPSGQKLNKEKTSIFFSYNTTIEVQNEILEVVGIPATQRYNKYLGLPTLVGKSKNKAFQEIKDRSLEKITGLEIAVSILGGEGDFIEGSYSSYPYV